MKKLFVAALAVLSLNLCNAQDTQMKGAFSLEFGSSKKTVKETILAKQPDAKVADEGEKYVSFDNVKWGKFTTYRVTMKFHKDSLHTIYIYIDPGQCHQIFNLYDEVVELMIERYNSPKNKNEYYRYPYDKSDKYKHTAAMVTNEKVVMNSLWQFDILGTPFNTEDDNSLVVSVKGASCLIQVAYQDGILIDAAIEADKAKNAKDY